MLSPGNQILYNVMYERGAQFILRSENAIAAQYPGKPLWLYADENWPAENLRVFFNACLQKKNDIKGLVSSKYAVELCLKDVSAAWEVAAFYLPQPLAYLPRGCLIFPSSKDVPMLSGWVKAFYREALDSDFPDTEIIEALVSAKKLYCLNVAGCGLCAMGMQISVDSDTYKMGRLNMIYTPPRYRGQGFGKDVAAAIAIIIQSQGRLPVLYARVKNITAMNLYRSLGFIEAGRLVEVRF